MSGAYGSIPVDEESVEVAKVYAKNLVNGLVDYSHTELKELKKYADDGHWTWKILGLTAGILIVAVHALSFLSDLFGLAPFTAVLDMYIIFFGLVAIVLEYKTNLLPAYYVNKLRKEALFLYLPYGRAGFYFFIGIIIVIRGGYLNFLVGIYTIAVGIFIYYGSTSALAKLNQIKASKLISEHEITKKFYEYDKNGNGSIDSKELQALCTSLDIILSENEVESALFILDTDCDGSIDLNEFKAWLQVTYAQ